VRRKQTLHRIYSDVLDCSFAGIQDGVPPAEGVFMRRNANGEGRGACGFGLVSRASGGVSGRHCPGPTTWVRPATAGEAMNAGAKNPAG